MRTILTCALLLVPAVLLSFYISCVTSAGWPLMANVSILYVSGSTGKADAAHEEKIRRTLGDFRKERNIFSGYLAVYSYHFDKPQERTVCEEKFDIHEKDLPFLSVVEIDEKNLPTKVLFRLSGVQGEKKELSAFFEKAVAILKRQ